MVNRALLLLAIISMVVYCASAAKFFANAKDSFPPKPKSNNILPIVGSTTASTNIDPNANEVPEMPRLFTHHEFTARQPVSQPRLDVVFAIDSTGSMGDEIEVVKQNIRNIINDISQATPAPDVRYGIVTYRDQGDEYLTRKWLLTRDMTKIVTALNSLVAAGGGDKEEAVAEALHVSLQEINWDQQANSKLVFLIGDAGPHRWSTSANDHSESGFINWQDELSFAQQRGITINTIACSGIETHEMTAFQQMSAQTNGSFAHLTYKQEVVRSDGSRAVVLEEAGRTYEVAGEAAKNWERGAAELVARREAKASSAEGYDADVAARSREADTPAKPARSAEAGFLGKVANHVEKLLTPSATVPVAAPASPPATESVKVAADVAKAKPATVEAPSTSTLNRSLPMAEVSPMATPQPIESKTNNLHSILAGSIKQAARKQGATYGTPITPITTIAGTNSKVKNAQSVLLENTAQLAEFVGNNAEATAHIDFNRQVVVAIFLGPVTTETKLTVNSLSLNNNELVVRYRRETTAVKGNFTPYQLVVIPRQIAATTVTGKGIFLQVEEDK